MTAPEYVASRRVLLDAFAALDEHLTSVVRPEARYGPRKPGG